MEIIALIYVFLSQFTAMCGFLQLGIVLYGHLWSYMAFYDLILYVLLWSYMAILLCFMAFYGKI